MNDWKKELIENVKSENYNIWNVNDFPLHMRIDVKIHNDNVKRNKILCKECDGTGNMLFSMYQKCSNCNGVGCSS